MGTRGSPASPLAALCLSPQGDLCIPLWWGRERNQTISLFVTPGGLWMPQSQVLSLHHSEAQRGEGTCLQSHNMPTGDPVHNLLLFPSKTFQKKPTFVLSRKYHLAQQTGTLEVLVLCKVDRRERRTNSFIMEFSSNRPHTSEKCCGKSPVSGDTHCQG